MKQRSSREELENEPGTGEERAWDWDCLCVEHAGTGQVEVWRGRSLGLSLPHRTVWDLNKSCTHSGFVCFQREPNRPLRNWPMSKEILHVGLSLTRVIIQEEPVPAITWKVGERLLIDKRNCVTSARWLCRVTLTSWFGCTDDS